MLGIQLQLSIPRPLFRSTFSQRMLEFLRPVRWTAIIASLIVVAAVLAEVSSIHFLSPAISLLARGFSGDPASSLRSGFWGWIASDSPHASQLRTVLLWMAGSQLILGTLIFMRSIWESKFNMDAVFHIRAAVYDRLQHAHFSLYDEMSSGQLINRAISDLQAVRTFLIQGLLGSLDILASLASCLALLYFRSKWLMLAALLPMPLWLWIILRFSRAASPHYSSQQKASDRLMKALTENISGVRVIRAFGTERREVDRYRKLNSRMLGRMLGLVHIQAQLTPSLKAIATLAHISLFVLSAHFIRQGKIEIGDVMILGFAMGMILMKLQQVNQIAELYQKARVSSTRLFEVLDAPTLAPCAQAASPVLKPLGDIEFSEVSFSYGSGAPVIRDASLLIPGGRVTAIAGPTASGKSTLVSLIARFYDPQKGSIRIGGQDLRSLSLKNLRHKVGIVFQETFLFSNTIRENIRYGRKDVNDEMLLAASVAAQAHEFIEALPQGYDTLLGEGGVQLSGGQRQRLALARALVYDPKVLILDDPLAALDSQTRASVQANLNTAFEGRTVIWITHQAQSLPMADSILFLDQGKITRASERAVELPTLSPELVS